MDETQIKLCVEIFEEWKRRWDTNPSEFDLGWFIDPPTYGELAAKYFAQLWDELSGMA